MKHNLKTFPEHEKGCDCCEVYHRWKQQIIEELQQLKGDSVVHLKLTLRELIKEILGENQSQPETKYATLEIPEDLKEALNKSVISPIDVLWDAVQKEGENQHG